MTPTRQAPADRDLETARRMRAFLDEVESYNGVYAGIAGDSSAADNPIDSVIAPSDQLSPGSGGVLRAVEGIVP